jgi:hypothetical protein
MKPPSGTRALSTAFARAAALSPSQILDAIGRAGAGAVVLDAQIDPVRFNALVGSIDLPILAIEAPCPETRESSAQLCSADREEARVALAAAEATVRRAGELEAGWVVLRLGEVRSLTADWNRARALFQRGELDEDDGRAIAELRDRSGARELDAARRAIDRLARAAEVAGVGLAIRNGRRFVDVPTARELDLLLADNAGAPVGPLFDVAAAQLPAAMSIWPFALTQAAFGVAELVYFSDACGPLCGLPPGAGELDLAAIAAALPKRASWAYVPWSGLAVEESLAAFTSLCRAWPPSA